MRGYVVVSGTFLLLVTGVQILRLVLRWQVVVAGVEIPLWASALAAVIAGSLGIWAFRVSARASTSTDS